MGTPQNRHAQRKTQAQPQDSIVEEITRLNGVCEKDLVPILNIHPLTLRRKLDGLVYQGKVRRLSGRTRSLDYYVVYKKAVTDGELTRLAVSVECPICQAQPGYRCEIDPDARPYPSTMRIGEAESVPHRAVTKGGDWMSDPRDPRIPRDELFLHICRLLRLRSTCKRGRVGALLVRDNRIISSGYNGSPPGAPHCFELGCEMEPCMCEVYPERGDNHHPYCPHEQGCTRTIHAETNCIIQAARHGISTVDATMYCTHMSCARCAVIVASSGVRRFVYEKEYRRGREDLLTSQNIEVVQLTPQGDEDEIS